MISLESGVIVYKSKSLNNLKHKDQILNHIDTFLRDAEIRGYWEGLASAGVIGIKRMHNICSHFNVSDETIKNTIYRKTP